MLNMTYPFANTYHIQSTTTPQNGFLAGASMTMLLVIINLAVRWCAHPRCTGHSLRSPLNQWPNQSALLRDGVFSSCTWSHQVSSPEIQCCPSFRWPQPLLPAARACSAGAQFTTIVSLVNLAFTFVQPLVKIYSMCPLQKSIVS